MPVTFYIDMPDMTKMGAYNSSMMPFLWFFIPFGDPEPKLMTMGC